MKAFIRKNNIKKLNEHGEIVDAQVFEPHDEATRKYLARRGPGQVIIADIRIARNYENHKRFFDFLNASFDMQEFYSTLEQYRRWITIQAGWFDVMVYPDGTTTLVPRSIAFENMEEDEFQKLFKSAITAFLEEFGNGITENDLMRIISYD